MVKSYKACSCTQCVECCEHYPGWMTIAEAEAALAAGMAGRLMLDWFEPDSKLKNEERIYVLCPAGRGYEGRAAPSTDDLFSGGFLSAILGDSTPMPCTFLENGLCSIHESGFKPLMCRATMGCGEDDQTITKHAMVPEWDSARGKAVIAKWREIVNLPLRLIPIPPATANF